MSAPRVRRVANAIRQRPAASVIVAVSLLLVCFYGAHAVAVSARGGSGGDFGSGYVAATMIRDGDASRVYDLQAQHTLGAQLLPGQRVLPFEGVALGAAAQVPLSWLPLPSAFLVWDAIQVVLVILAGVVAVRATPARRARALLVTLAIAGVAVTHVGLDNLVAIGQWTGVNALGIAMAYRSWRRGAFMAGGAWLVASAALFKPHLALGLVVFLIAWGNRRALLGAAAAAAAGLMALVALVGLGGVRALIGNDIGLNGALNQQGGASIVALPSMWFSDTSATYVVGLIASCAVLALCALLGRRLRRDGALLSPALATATALSLLASPHAFLYDYVMLVPAVAWSLAELRLLTDRQPRTLYGAWTIVALWAAAPWIQRVFAGEIAPVVARVGYPDVWFSIILAAALWAIPAETRARSKRVMLIATLPAG